MGRAVDGQGTIISDAASKMLAQAKPGQTVTFICRYTDGKTGVKFGAVTISLQ